VVRRVICDYAEFTDDIPGDLGPKRLIWRDERDERVPTYQVVSLAGPEHCDWTSMTFTYIANRTLYVRRPLAELAQYFDQPFQADIPLPADAVDTGFHRDADRLWRSSDKTRAYVGQPGHVEVWPRPVKPLGCA
jgi:hypothetical protein